LVVGLAGLLDLGYVASCRRRLFLCVAGDQFRISFWVCLPLAGILAAFGVCCRLSRAAARGDYLAIVTLAFGEIIRLVIINWQSLTAVQRCFRHSAPTLFGIPLSPGDDGLAAMLGIEFSPTHRIVFLFIFDPRIGAAHQLGDDPVAAAADRPCLGSVARGRSRLPRARHQHHHTS